MTISRLVAVSALASIVAFTGFNIEPRQAKADIITVSEGDILSISFEFSAPPRPGANALAWSLHRVGDEASGFSVELFDGTTLLGIMGADLVGAPPTDDVAQGEFLKLGTPAPRPISSASAYLIDFSSIADGTILGLLTFSDSALATINTDNVTVGALRRFDEANATNYDAALITDISVSSTGTTVPLPSALYLLLSGLFGLGLFVRHRRETQQYLGT